MFCEKEKKIYLLSHIEVTLEFETSCSLNKKNKKKKKKKKKKEKKKTRQEKKTKKKNNDSKRYTEEKKKTRVKNNEEEKYKLNSLLTDAHLLFLSSAVRAFTRRRRPDA